jgi:integrase
MSGFQSVFAERLAGYVELRRRLGLRFNKQEEMLRAFDRYAHHHGHQGLLTDELARAFALAVPHTSTTVPGRRYLVVRHFAEYLATFEPRTPRLDPKAICRARRQPPPYVFTAEELELLLRRALEYSPKFRSLSRAVHAMVGLGASAGLRLREVLGLDMQDVDFDTGVVIVRQSKFHKDRLVPTHATTLDVLRGYAAIRDKVPRRPEEAAFFLSTRGRRFKALNVEHIFRRLVRSTALRPPREKPPTFYSLRHTFAVRRLIAWYHAGANVQALLPTLATYMGHVHYTSTAYYLTATAELLGVAAVRVAAMTAEASRAKDE